ncbi:MAG: F0F1 ATP synthase subunit delta [Pseudomonadales bacterium]|jgi:F-type H+-transporting ATPase subunit delta|nr:F0F1 ATP synthase subunit delta [Pseudomonadales bacterium]
MAEIATLARPYARAAFEAAREDGDDGLTRWSRMLALLRAVTGNDALARELEAPSRSVDARAQLLIDVLGDEISDKVRNLLRVLAANKRLELLGEIALQYEALKDAFERTLEVEVVTARPLSDDDAERLRSGLAKRFDKQVALSSRVDASLLGGAVIHAGDTVIDGSVRGRLQKLADTLRAN